MASVVSHVVSAAALGACFHRPGVPARVWALGALYAVLPDLDVVGFAFGIPYEHVLGHRGITHSLAFAAALAAVTIVVGFPRGVPGLGPGVVGTYLFLAAASHGVLDALTDGGRGVAFFAPFENSRHFFPYRPIRVSRIGIEWFFSRRGLEVVRSEAVWVGLPSALLALVALGVRRVTERRRRETSSGPATRVEPGRREE